MQSTGKPGLVRPTGRPFPGRPHPPPEQQWNAAPAGMRPPGFGHQQSGQSAPPGRPPHQPLSAATGPNEAGAGPSGAPLPLRLPRRRRPRPVPPRFAHSPAAPADPLPAEHSAAARRTGARANLQRPSAERSDAAYYQAAGHRPDTALYNRTL